MKKSIIIFNSIILICIIMCNLFFFAPTYSFADKANVEDTRAIPILMYHSVLKSRKGQYSVSPSMLEEDIKYLKKHAYTAVFIQDIIDFCENKKDLPKKPVVLTFDDGYYNNFYYAYPLIKKYNFKANLNVIGCFTDFSTTSGNIDNPNYSYITWDEIKTLHDSGFFEIGNHTYKMHSFKPRFGIAQKDGESDYEYNQALTKDVMKLETKLKDNCNIRTNVFAYPFGKYSKKSETILKNLGFKAFLTCNEGINKVKKGETKTLTLLKRINRTGLISTEEFFEKFKIK